MNPRPGPCPHCTSGLPADLCKCQEPPLTLRDAWYLRRGLPRPAPIRFGIWCERLWGSRLGAAATWAKGPDGQRLEFASSAEAQAKVDEWRAGLVTPNVRYRVVALDPEAWTKWTQTRRSQP